jgi:hypothetical protein
VPAASAADFSLALLRSYFCTLSNIVIDAKYNRGTNAGHHGIEVSRGRDNLVTDCVFKAPQVRLLVERGMQSTVMVDVTGGEVRASTMLRVHSFTCGWRISHSCCLRCCCYWLPTSLLQLPMR